jgi:hypothetical protein
VKTLKGVLFRQGAATGRQAGVGEDLPDKVPFCSGTSSSASFMIAVIAVIDAGELPRTAWRVASLPLPGRAVKPTIPIP